MSNRTLSLFALIGAVILVHPVSAQLSGTYTVDNAQPTGGGNYNNLQEAAAALSAQGVSGPVVFSINTGTGPTPGSASPAPSRDRARPTPSRSSPARARRP